MTTLTWRDQLPLRFATPINQDNLLTPHGSAPPLHTLTFHDKHTELSWLIETQLRELAPLSQEFAANGLAALSLSSSPPSEDDDDLTTANLAEHHLREVPFEPNPIELAARQRRYDWEHYILSCSTSARLYARRSTSNKHTVIACSDRRWTPERIAEYAIQIRNLLANRSINEVENDRQRAQHYGRIVWATMTPEEQDAWTVRNPAVNHYLDSADDNTNRDNWILSPDAPSGSSEELGFHWLDSDLGGPECVVLPEPSEYDLWPENDAIEAP